MLRILIHKKRFQKKKMIACIMLSVFLIDIIRPSVALALTGGPSQPEVQSFEPVGTSDMVDLFSGDFNYNIPLLDVEGYPVNISYHSGITMDQEASWVGLGWNINPGVINRNLRGIPDDFNGDIIEKEFSMKENKTYGVNLGFGAELFGLDFLSLNYSLGIKYNNYSGVGAEQSVSLSINAAQSGKSPLNVNLGLTSSSDEGLTIAPSVSMQATIASNKDKSESTSLGISIGSSFNSRQGLKGLTISANVSQNYSRANYNSKGERIKKKNGRFADSNSGFGYGGSASFDFTQPTYSPKSDFPLKNISITGRFTIGGELFGINGHLMVGGYYANQYLTSHHASSPSYGYLNLEAGTTNDHALLDFNREKDGAYTTSTPALPLATQTFDTYSVSGQGVGGSYRPYRGDIGYVYDPTCEVTSDGGSIGAEIGLGEIFKFGVDVNANMVTTTTGKWSSDNIALHALNYTADKNNPLYEKSYFKEANEKSVDSDPAFLEKMGGTEAQAIRLRKAADFFTLADARYDNGQPLSPSSHRNQREHRNQEFSYLTREEIQDKRLGTENFDSLSLYQAPKHHIAEVTTYAVDGRRYVYGIAAYNTYQKEVTFSVGENTLIPNSNMVSYVPGVDNSIDNKKGTENYFNSVTTPAFAHGFLLTSVLSADYIDADGVKGPSDGDFGNFTKFHYQKIEDYKWRSPVDQNSANYNEALRNTTGDDKGNYLFGSKEMYYLDRIETKNYIAIFQTEKRADARGVLNENGGIDTDSARASRLLRSITLYSKPDYKANGNSASPIKKVNFVYDYSLCKGIANADYDPSYISDLKDVADPAATGVGKLTLKKIFFTYQKSQKGRLSPYVFNYSGVNPDYSTQASDRWGNYKNSNGNCVSSFSDYSYVNQEESNADSMCTAWTLNEISLPSGGVIKVDFESDDYGYVQDKLASQMFVIEGNGNGIQTFLDSTLVFEHSLYYFHLQRDGQGDLDRTMSHYASPGDLIYFRFLVEIGLGKKEFIPGYSRISKIGSQIMGADTLGYVEFKPVGMEGEDSTANPVSPIVRTAIQYARVNCPKLLWQQPTDVENMDFSEQLINALVESKSVVNEIFNGPNANAYSHSHCQNFVPKQSWIRLNNPLRKKYGGGCRVKKIEMNDKWNRMTEAIEDSASYGQEYYYVNADGTSSGVATYEPQLGSDENSLRQPYYYKETKLLVPDQEHYMEEPFGEFLYPGPGIGYGRVTVMNLQNSSVHRHATGSVVHEFYTARDFPTISTKTIVQPVRDKSDPWSFTSIFHLDSRDYMTVSQGYAVEVNDMHGKPKSQMVFAEGQNTPISSIEYKYQQQPYLNGTFRLSNDETVIFPDGNVAQRNIGMNVDMVADFRESYTSSYSAGVQLNLDGFSLVILPLIVIPSVFPSFAHDRTQFRSAVTTKLVQRFGILEETIVKDLGSEVHTKNLAYDAYTGDVLLTQTIQDFNDPLYSFTFPAHWYYSGMGPASSNLGAVIKNLTVQADGLININNAPAIFTEGDELAVIENAAHVPVHAWVSKVTPTSITIINKPGLPVNTGTYTLKIIRSGRRNQQSAPMAQITTLTNPLQSLTSNAYSKILQASAIEYTNTWKTYCDCLDDSTSDRLDLDVSTNPFVIGTKGYWKPQKSYLHLADRTQSKYDNNTNIRKDGVFASFTPFYKFSGGRWVMDEPNWTYTSEVTNFSPFGPELENMDALGKYSAATFGFNQSLATSVSANARYRDVGFDSFEDYSFSACADDHFKITKPSNANSLINHVSHSGRNSIRVASSDTVLISKQLALNCIPPDPCNVSICYSAEDSSSQVSLFFSSEDSSATFSVDWEIIGGIGTKQVIMSNTGIEISSISVSESFSLVLDISISGNCVIHRVVKISTNVDGIYSITGADECSSI